MFRCMELLLCISRGGSRTACPPSVTAEHKRTCREQCSRSHQDQCRERQSMRRGVREFEATRRALARHGGIGQRPRRAVPFALSENSPSFTCYRPCAAPVSRSTIACNGARITFAASILTASSSSGIAASGGCGEWSGPERRFSFQSHGQPLHDIRATLRALSYTWPPSSAVCGLKSDRAGWESRGAARGVRAPRP
jgi:hypothetical protein